MPKTLSALAQAAPAQAAPLTLTPRRALAAALLAAGTLVAGLAPTGAQATQLAFIELPDIDFPDIEWPKLPDIGLYKNEAGLAPAPLPRYRVGQRFTFSDGTSETVPAVENGKVVWRIGDSGKTVRSHSFLDGWAPVRQLRVVDRPTGIWPLEVGSFDRLRTQGSKRTEDGTTQPARIRDHACQVMGSERITVAAGTFDAYRVECKRYGQKRMVERRIWHFAPALDHYVRYERITRKGGRQEYRELVSSAG